MANKDYSDVPHYGLIRDNETIEIDSVFQFKGGFQELNLFLNACMARNCTVHFLNEDLTAEPGGNRLTLNLYATVASDPELAERYLIYLLKLNRGEIKPLD